MESPEQVLAELKALSSGPERLQAARDALAAIYCSMVGGDTKELELYCIQAIRDEVLRNA